MPKIKKRKPKRKIDSKGAVGWKKGISIFWALRFNGASLTVECDKVALTLFIKYFLSFSKAKKREKINPARTRTWNLLLRRQTRYPLRHRVLNKYLNNKKRGVLGEGTSPIIAAIGFDPMTFGLWVQHASTAPRCFKEKKEEMLAPWRPQGQIKSLVA